MQLVDIRASKMDFSASDKEWDRADWPFQACNNVELSTYTSTLESLIVEAKDESALLRARASFTAIGDDKISSDQ